MMIIIRGRNGNGKGSLWCFCLNKGVFDGYFDVVRIYCAINDCYNIIENLLFR